MDEMTARGNGADASARLTLRLPLHGSRERRQSSSSSSDSEDDAPIAVHFSKYMKTERAARGGPAHNSSGVDRGSDTTPSVDTAQVCANASSSSSGPAALHRTSESPSSPPSVPTKDGSKRPKPDAPKFLLLLYEILQTENPKVIRWSEDGLSLQILDQTVVTESILPKYFNHTNFHSFQRQLNYFGFRKWTKSKTDICTFSHPYFRQSQPELLQVIKRKKAPRRPASATATATGTPTAIERTAADGQQRGTLTTLATLSQSPTSKRKLSAVTTDAELQHSFHEVASGLTLQQHQQRHGLTASAASIHPSLHGIVIAPLSQHHQHALVYCTGTPMQRDAASGQYLQASALLNNVISPLAASESNKKAKKIDKTACKPEYQSPTDSSVTSMSDYSMPGSSFSSSTTNQLSSVTANVYSSSSHSLPTLDIVRNRIIRRQNVSNAGHATASNEQHPKPQTQLYATSYLGYSSSPGSGQQHRVSAAVAATAMSTQHALNSSRGELRGEGKASVSSPAAFPSASFSDPVDILLRIKKSRALSSTEGQQQQHYSGGEGLVSPAGATLRGAGGADSNHHENLASLQSFIVNHTLYTNRLESQLKMAIEENDALKALVDVKHRELEEAQGESKRLQNENAVLVDDQIKLLEINRELAVKLFPQ